MSNDRYIFTNGAEYERTMGRWSQLAGAEFIDWLGAPAGACWLDVGCGNGAFSEVLMGRCPPSALHGIDPSEAQVAYAKSRKSISNGTFRTADAQSLPFEDASFDVATMALVIPFVPDPKKAVSEMARVVQPGGLVASYMWDVPAGGLPAEPLYAATRDLGLSKQASAVSNAAVYSLSDIQNLWQRLGLKEIETHRIDVSATYADFDDFWESNAVLRSPQSQLVEALQPTERQRLKSYLDETLPRDAEGRISCRAFANAVKGRV